jgi:hypothetical protein
MTGDADIEKRRESMFLMTLRRSVPPRSQRFSNFSGGQVSSLDESAVGWGL